MKVDYDKIKEEDFIIRIRPYIDNEGSWSGDIDVAIITQPDNNMDDDDYFQIMHFCKMIASSIPVMEFNEDFRELVHKYVVEKVESYTESDINKKPKVLNKDGNVVEIDFKTKTKGNA